MSVNETPTAERTHIGFFGARNAGKSSIVNAVTGQPFSIVSDVAGTTTDAVSKSMELLPLGPVNITDTAGFDDEGTLGAMRIEKTRLALYRTDIAVLVTDATRPMGATEQTLIELFTQQKIPYLVVRNKADLLSEPQTDTDEVLWVSAKTGQGIHGLKERIGAMGSHLQPTRHIVSDLLQPNDTVVLVTPIDAAAPKGRLILPQQQTLREVIDIGGIAVVTQPEQLPQVLTNLQKAPRMIITDSQVFGPVEKMLPDDIPLTSFSILMARYKGFLETAVQGIEALRKLHDGAKLLIAEGCTHHRQCGDIGTVKLPKLLQTYTGRQFDFSFTSGGDFPEDLSQYALVVHCGGCMRTEREMSWRMRTALAQGVPFTNYGIALAACNGILERALMPGTLT
ncbi:MAG: [FeFe] hydrogenase H-cluster maturation GTPase HydF [Oscillospiraceae bacterium]